MRDMPLGMWFLNWDGMGGRVPGVVLTDRRTTGVRQVQVGR